jgi:hypothetical protein
MICLLSILPIPKGIPTWGYPPVSFEPYITRVSGCLPASRYPRQPDSFSGLALTGIDPLAHTRNEKESGSSPASRRTRCESSRPHPRVLEGGVDQRGNRQNQRVQTGEASPQSNVLRRKPPGARTRSVFHRSPAMTAGFFAPRPSSRGKDAFAAATLEAYRLPAAVKPQGH